MPDNYLLYSPGWTGNDGSGKAISLDNGTIDIAKSSWLSLPAPSASKP